MPYTLTAKAPFLEVPRKEIKSYWPSRGQWTYEDYLRLPDDGNRYEIIDGVLYVTNAPNYDHQFTVSELHLQIASFVKEKRLGVVLTAPFEIHLPNIAKPVQPDVIAKKRQPKRGDKFFIGAPDLIIEVISPSSVRTDRHIKFSAYERAGVKEYWLADPRTCFVEVYTLQDNTQEYQLLGQFGPGEQLSSVVLPDLALVVDLVFLPC
jgi:Uma2 family endonuclease